MTFKVIQVYWYWCHSTGHTHKSSTATISLSSPFSIYYQLLPNILRRYVTLNTSCRG